MMPILSLEDPPRGSECRICPRSLHIVEKVASHVSERLIDARRREHGQSQGSTGIVTTNIVTEAMLVPNGRTGLIPLSSRR